VAEKKILSRCMAGGRWLLRGMVARPKEKATPVGEKKAAATKGGGGGG
jgi:hypothetical protein